MKKLERRSSVKWENVPKVSTWPLLPSSRR